MGADGEAELAILAPQPLRLCSAVQIEGVNLKQLITVAKRAPIHLCISGH
ncbi:MAG: hypothetical protein KAW00_03185 [Dehalococcoidia bacterium]|nr:hypothetical protein [Dehalococcoidia bacterium]